jgi:hypothetical protein
MKITILNAIIWWGGIFCYFVWDPSQPKPEESWYSIFFDPILWGVVIFLQLINWVIRKIFHKQVAVESNNAAKALEKVANSTK